MTGTINRYGIYEVDHTKFGGIIYHSDFDTIYTNRNIASRIVSDWIFDKQCRKNIESKNINKKQEENHNDWK